MNDVHALEIQGLNKTYANGTQAVRDISLKVEKGDFFALLGPNGAGKSTTIGVMTSLVQKTSGSVRIFGFDIEKNLEQAKLKIGLVPQEFNFNMFEQVLQIVVNQAGYYGVPKNIATERAEIYLKQLDLWEKRYISAKQLSGGMKRRLMIARALIHEPQLLILDEPTAGVDIELRRSMWDFLRTINEKGVTIILTTHYLEEAEMLCRNIGIIDQGKLVQRTTMKNLINQLNIETFIFDLAEDAPKISLENCHYRRIDATTLEVDVKKEDNLNHIFTQLSEQGVQVLSMRNKANRLEELFVQLIQTKQELSA